MRFWRLKAMRSARFRSTLLEASIISPIRWASFISVLKGWITSRMSSMLFRLSLNIPSYTLLMCSISGTEKLESDLIIFHAFSNSPSNSE
ncbi:Uncharacterised protein [Mycobacterium tuberculosis]|nr:Uncharacterised protein [Mycobacterium tuberculosis]